MTKHISASETLARLPGSAGQRFLEVFSHGSLVVEIYAPELVDPQTPHTRDEVYVVISGKGTYFIEQERFAFKPGDFLFAPAGAVHRFESFSQDFAAWVFFYGPEGGEKPE
jgi:mannose-6-phosphate isomerase-like protein (cupin superfamily)